MSDTFDFECKGLQFRCNMEIDSDMEAPWVEDDGHGAMREVSSYYGRPEKRPGEVVIYQDRGHYWLYDVQVSTKTARHDHWGLPADDLAKFRQIHGRPMTAGEVAAESVRRDMRYCSDWLHGDRFWQMIEVFQIDEDGEKIGESEYLGGIDSGYDDASEKHLRECAEELAGQMAARTYPG